MVPGRLGRARRASPVTMSSAMTETDAIRQRLLALRDELDATLTTAEEDSVPVDLDLSIGRLSRMDAIQQQERAKQRKAHVIQRLALVRQAIARLERGDYGECARCGDDIAAARLKARPEAPICLPCQEEMER